MALLELAAHSLPLPLSFLVREQQGGNGPLLDELRHLPPVMCRAGPGQKPNSALCSRWDPGSQGRRGKARLQRRSRENNGPHSEHQPRRHLERRPPNRQGLCQAAACPGTGSSTRTAEQGHAVCHTPMPASSLQARWEREAPGKKRGSPSQTRAPAPRISPPRRSDSVPAAAWRLPVYLPHNEEHGVWSQQTLSLNSGPRTSVAFISFLFCKTDIRIMTSQ